MRPWQTSRRRLALDRVLVMGILNVTPDSFSDGGRYASVDEALRHAEHLASEGADIIDIGGESTRPGSKKVTLEEEVSRTVPVIEAVVRSLDLPVSIDTSKSGVAERAAQAGAEIINDVSGLRFDASLAGVAARFGTGLVLMHSRGSFETMHSQEPVDDVIAEVSQGLAVAVGIAGKHGVADDQIVIDPGIGFGKTFDQNLELLAKLDKLKAEFPRFPLLVGASRKSFLGRLLGDASPAERLRGSLAAAVIAAWNGAAVVRVHDVRATVEALKVVEAVRNKL